MCCAGAKHVRVDDGCTRAALHCLAELCLFISAAEVLSWAEGKVAPPPSGTYVDITTADGKTSFTQV
jgi:hypothetical protein